VRRDTHTPREDMSARPGAMSHDDAGKFIRERRRVRGVDLGPPFGQGLPRFAGARYTPPAQAVDPKIEVGCQGVGHESLTDRVRMLHTLPLPLARAFAGLSPRNPALGSHNVPPIRLRLRWPPRRIRGQKRVRQRRSANFLGLLRGSVCISGQDHVYIGAPGGQPPSAATDGPPSRSVVSVSRELVRGVTWRAPRTALTPRQSSGRDTRRSAKKIACG
jgi:hypothetical protein